MRQGGDRRVIKTQALIRNTMATLMLEKPINKITVTDIAQRANINRGTFYFHFDDIYELIDAIENDFVESFEEFLTDYFSGGNIKSLSVLLTNVADFLEEDAEFNKKLLRGKYSAQLIEKLRISLIAKATALAEAVFKSLDTIKIKYHMIFIVSGITGLLQEWALSESNIPADVIAKYLEELLRYGVVAPTLHANRDYRS